MSDSGRQIGDCEHGRSREWCVICLREEVKKLQAELLLVDEDRIAITECCDKFEYEVKYLHELLLSTTEGNELSRRAKELVSQSRRLLKLDDEPLPDSLLVPD